MLTESERAALIRTYTVSGMFRVISDAAKQLCAPMWWNVPEELGPAGGMRGATVCLVQTGERLIGVTADHAHRALVELLENGATTVCQLGAHSFDPRELVIDRDEELDIATYQLNEIQVAASGHYTHLMRGAFCWEMNSGRCAPARDTKGQRISLAGLRCSQPTPKF
jgi:hypothetical protein